MRESITARSEKECAIIQHIRTIFKAIQVHSKRVEKACGLSFVRLTMLNEVARVPGIKVSQLASQLSIHRSTCSNLLDKLEENGLVWRNRTKADQRSVLLYVTEKGTETLKKAAESTEGKSGSSLTQLDYEQLVQLEKSLATLVEALYHDTKREQ